MKHRLRTCGSRCNQSSLGVSPQIGSGPNLTCCAAALKKKKHTRRLVPQVTNKHRKHGDMAHTCPPQIQVEHQGNKYTQ